MPESENGYSVCTWKQWQQLDESQREWERHRIMVMLDRRTANLEQMLAPDAYKPYVRKWSIITSAAITIIFIAGVIGLKITVGI